MRIRRTVITVALSAAAIGGMAASPALAAAHTPYVGHNVGGGLLTRQPLHDGQTINLVGSNGGRISGYRVTAVQHDGAVDYDTVWPRRTGRAGIVGRCLSSGVSSCCLPARPPPPPG